jgi:hypothetical protein
MAYMAGAMPVAPHIYFPRFLDDNNQQERGVRITAGIIALGQCEELWVFGMEQPSQGMKMEIDVALKLGIPLFDGFAKIAGYSG